MHKLKLDVDDLAVDSFAVEAAAGGRRGTVHARMGFVGQPLPISAKVDDTCLPGLCTSVYSCDLHDTCRESNCAFVSSTCPPDPPPPPVTGPIVLTA